MKRKEDLRPGGFGFRRAGTASDDLDWPRSLAVHWCDGSAEQDQDAGFRAKISGSKIGNNDIRGRSKGLTRAGGRRRSRRYGGRPTCQSALLAWAARNPLPCCGALYIVALAYDEAPAERVRQLIGNDPELTEKTMFGGSPSSSAATWPSRQAAKVAPWSASILDGRAPWWRRRMPGLVQMRGRDMPDGCLSVPTIWAPTISSPHGSRWASGTRARCCDRPPGRRHVARSHGARSGSPAVAPASSALDTCQT